MKTFIINSLILLISLCSYAQVHQRWDVKTLTDGFVPDTINVKKVTVKQIQAKPRIKVKNTQARMNSEKKVVRITGTITRIELEAGADGDGDYHIEVTDSTIGDSTFVCEAVDPDNSITKNSPYAGNFIKVRKVVKDLKKGDKVTFTGVLFQDKYHSPSPHRTRNFVEMHPILKARKNK